MLAFFSLTDSSQKRFLPDFKQTTLEKTDLFPARFSHLDLLFSPLKKLPFLLR